MKRQLHFLLTLLIIIGISDLRVFAQDPIDEYDGIPLVVYSWQWAPWLTDNNFVQMKDMGVFAAVSVDPLDPDSNNYNLDRFEVNGLKVIPYQIWRQPNNILTYTDAYYTKWEAEGTDTTMGEATLEYDENYTTYFNTNGIEGRKAGGESVPASTELIKGPGYPQMVYYESKVTINEEPIPVKYNTTFRMKIEERNTNLPTNYLEAVVCTLQVIATNPGGSTEIDVVPARVLTVQDFNGWGNWLEHEIVEDGYFLTGLSYEYLQDTTWDWQVPHSLIADHIQFKVIWSGLDFLDLYIDRIMVSDAFGMSIVTIPSVKDFIKTDVEDYIEHESIIGWYSMDEPGSIDKYEPFRIVDSIVTAVSQQHNWPIRLHTGFTAGWNGRYGHRGTGAHPLFPAKEFWLRAKPKNVQINMYNYHYPYKAGQITGWADSNITYVTDIYLNRINNFDTSFAFSTQAGKWNSVAGSVIPSPIQINYHVNLGLMYGAKELRLDPFFSVPDEVWGLIDENEDETENYYFFQNTLIPRLNGWFGKEIRKIHQVEQFTKLQLPVETPVSGYSWLESIGYVEGDGLQPPDFIDLGFFETHYGSEDVPYFMITSRWYSTALPGDSLIVHINKSNSGYINWNVSNFIDSSMQTIIEVGDIKMPHIVGDARLFKVYPVVLDGGTLIANEIAGDGMTLNGDMIIDNNATLSIWGNYIAKGDITIRNGSIINIENGKIIFEDGKKLIIDGPAYIQGTDTDKLILAFEPAAGSDSSGGIVIRPVASLNISYCEINNASTGILSEVNAHHLSAEYVEFNNCTSSAVAILGQQGGEQPSTPPPPEIKYCSINNSGWGISVSNLSQVVIQQNQITNTNLGINLSNVSSPLIVGNIISTGTATLPGIMMLSSGGVVRGNFINGHTNGILLANSFSDLGGNTIENNFNKGLYSGAGSLPNLRAKLVQDPIHPNIFYAVSGYNKIRDNGGLTLEDLGSEIFIYHSNVLLKGGCNEISDQRIPNTEDIPPLYNTQTLMDGEGRITGNDVYAMENFWDEHPVYPLEERFGDYLNVLYEPVLSEPCPQPQGDDDIFLLTSSSGEVVDTIYAEEREFNSLTSTELLYANAEENFLSAEYQSAEDIYNQILTGNDSLKIKLDAYKRIYETGRLLYKSESYFNDLNNTFASLSEQTEDTLMKKIFSQLAALCLVSETEYVPAINVFDEIVQQKQGSEEAVYAEIDAITASLLVEGNDSTLQKGSLKKYLVKSSSDYFSKLDEILRNNFGTNKPETEKEILPTEYTLYQNYPNPFNPTTTIKYDLPTTSEVSLSIYDVLGRKVKTLVNQNQQAGRYEISFNATGLASGVYIYQLSTEKYVNTKKMILLK